MHISTDSIVFWSGKYFSLNATVVFTWAVMAVLVLVARAATRCLTVGPPVPPLQNALEIVVETIRNQIADIWSDDPDSFVPFIGTLFLFISTSSLLSILPGFHSPTASLSTTAALALCVFVAVPANGILRGGLWAYLKDYLEPTFLMLPIHVMGEISRTLALALRLYGNMMSGVLVVGVLLAVAPLFFPILMQILELLIGQIQAYIFAILAMVYIASSAREQHATRKEGAPSHG